MPIAAFRRPRPRRQEAACLPNYDWHESIRNSSIRMIASCRVGWQCISWLPDPQVDAYATKNTMKLICPISTTSRCVLAPLLGALVLALSGCATEPKATTAPRPGQGLAEYTQLVDRSRHAVESMQRSLEKVAGQRPPCPPKLVSAFSEDVDHLAVESTKVRARSQAIQARGDAYFQNWQTNMAALTNPRVRELAETHRSDLQLCFAKIKSTSQETRGVFEGYLAGLRNLRKELEKDPNALATQSAQELARTTRQQGTDIEKGLDAVAQELKAMTTMLTPTGTSAKH
jgi:hypothetical protein